MVDDESQLLIIQHGTISLPSSIGLIHIPNVLNVPGLCKTLLSIQSLARDLDCRISFDEHGFFVQAKRLGKVILLGNSQHGLYHLFDQAPTSTNFKYSIMCP